MKHAVPLVAALWLGTVFAVVPTAAADQNSCEVLAPATTCSFHCHGGYFVHVKVEAAPAEPVEGRATCSTAVAYCISYESCEFNSFPTFAVTAATGTCELLQGSKATCTGHPNF